MSVTSTPASGDAYALSETIRVTLTFSEAVVATGTPRLKIDMDPASWGEKWAVYESGSGSSSLVFAHTVISPNYSTQGIAVLANSLRLNGGTIRSDASVDANLAHSGLNHDPNHEVNWHLPRRPRRRPTHPEPGSPAPTAGRFIALTIAACPPPPQPADTQLPLF